jgi:hypothetical protein
MVNEYRTERPSSITCQKDAVKCQKLYSDAVFLNNGAPSCYSYFNVSAGLVRAVFNT